MKFDWCKSRVQIAVVKQQTNKVFIIGDDLEDIDSQLLVEKLKRPRYGTN